MAWNHSLFVPPYKKIETARRKADALQAERDEQKMLPARATREVNWLKTVSTYRETIARERLDLMKEGETVFRLGPVRTVQAAGALYRWHAIAAGSLVKFFYKSLK